MGFQQNVRNHIGAVLGKNGMCSCQLNQCGCPISLTDTYGNGVTGYPVMLVAPFLPGFGRKVAERFLVNIDARALAHAEF